MGGSWFRDCCYSKAVSESMPEIENFPSYKNTEWYNKTFAKLVKLCETANSVLFNKECVILFWNFDKSKYCPIKNFSPVGKSTKFKKKSKKFNLQCSAARFQEFSWDLQKFHILSRLSQDNEIFVKISRIITFLLQNAIQNRKFHKIVNYEYYDSIFKKLQYFCSCVW